MQLDSQLVFSDAQAITATAASTNIIDLGATGTVPYAASALVRDIGKGKPLPLLVQVVEAFNNCTSVQCDIEVDDNSSFSSPRVVDSQVLLLAGLTLGAKYDGLRYVPPGVNERYMRLKYTPVGTAPTLGKITAGIIAAHQENP